MTAARARILLAVIAFDVILMPVLPVLFLPASLILVAIILILQWRRDSFRLNSRARLLVAVLLASLVLSYLTKPSTVAMSNAVLTTSVNTHQEDTKRVLYLLLALALYVVARYLMRLGGVAATARHLRFVMVVALLNCGFMFLLFVTSSDTYASVRSLLFGTDVDLRGLGELQAAGYTERFGYVLLDPNNAAYYMLALAVFALYNLRLPGILKGYCVLLIVAIPFATRSLGGLIAAMTCIVASGLVLLNTRKSVRLLVTICSALSVLVGLLLVDSLFNLGFIETLIRSQSDVFDRWEANSADSRISNWNALISGPLPPIIGSGYVLVVNGHWFNPHSDHFRLMYSYGVMAYACVAAEAAFGGYFHRRFLFLIPILAAFSANSFLDESRFLFSGALLLAFAKLATADERGQNESAHSQSAKAPSPVSVPRIPAR